MSMIEKKWLADGAVDNSKIDHAATYAVGGLTSTGAIGIGTAAPLADLHVRSTATEASVRLELADGILGRSYLVSSDASGDFIVKDIAASQTRLTIDSVGRTTFASDATISGNLTVQGTTTIINTEVIAEELIVSQANNRTAFLVKQTGIGNTAPVLVIQNAGTGPALTTDSGLVGIGTTIPLVYKLHVYGNNDDAVAGSIKAHNASDGADTVAYVTVQSGTVSQASGSIGAYSQIYSNSMYAGRAVLASHSDSSGLLVMGNAVGSDIRFAIASSEMMRVTSTGVGIGTNPTKLLDLYSSDNTILQIRGQNRGQVRLNTVNETGWQVEVFDASAVGFNHPAGALGFTEAGVRGQVTFAKGGNVGIGVTNPLAKLHVTIDNTSAYSPSVFSGDGLYLQNANTGGSNLNFTALKFNVSANGLESAQGAISMFQVANGYREGVLTIQMLNSLNVTKEIMRISSEGNIGVDTTAPTAPLHVRRFVGSSGCLKLEGDDVSVGMPQINFFNSRTSGSAVVAWDGTTLNYNKGIKVDSGNGLFTEGIHVSFNGLNGWSQVTGTDNRYYLGYGVLGAEAIKVTVDTAGILNLVNDIRWGTWSSGASGQAIAGSTLAQGTIRFYTGGIERVQFDSSGNVGIGTVPVSVLDMYKPSPAITMRSSNSGGGKKIDMLDMGTKYNWRIAAQESTNNAFEITPSDNTGSTSFSSPAITILGDRRVLINTTTDAYLSGAGLRVNGAIISDATGTAYCSAAFTARGVQNQDSAIVLGQPNVINWRIRNVATTGSLAFGVGASDQLMCINTSGNVGIGTIDPQSNLHVESATSHAVINVKATGSGFGGYLDLYGNRSGDDVFAAIEMLNKNDTVAKINGMRDGADDRGAIVFATQYSVAQNTLERMRIDSTGRVGIGLSNPSQKFQVYGTADSQWLGYFQSNASTGNSNGVIIDAGTNNADGAFYVRNKGATTPYFYVRGDGKVGVGTNVTPDPLTVGSDGSGNNIRIIGRTTGAKEATIHFMDDAGGTHGWVAGQSGRLDFYGGSTNTMSLSSSGNVGIGTGAPARQLSVFNSNNLNSGTNGFGFYDATGNILVRLSSAGSFLPNLSQGLLQLGNQGTMTVSINSASASYFNGGLVGFGTAIPTTLLHLYGNQTGNWVGTVDNYGTQGHQIYMAYNDSSTTTYGLYVQGGRGMASQLDFAVKDKFYVMGNGTVGVGTTLPQKLLHVYNASSTVASTLFENGSATPGQGVGITFITNEGSVGTRGSIELYKDSASGGAMVFKVWEQLSGQNIERMRIKNTGTVGIGTIPATGKVHIYGNQEIINCHSSATAGDNYVGFRDSTGTQVGWLGYGASSSSEFHVWNARSDKLSLATAGTRRLTITSDGRVGINSTSPSNLLNVYGVVVSDYLTKIEQGASYGHGLEIKVADIAAMNALWSHGSLSGSDVVVRADGKVGIGTLTPVSLLHLRSNLPYLTFEDTDSTSGILSNITGNSDGHMYYQANSNASATAGGHVFRGGLDVRELVRITSAGKVGIGIDAPYGPLDVRQTVTSASKQTDYIYLSTTQSSGAWYSDLGIRWRWSDTANGVSWNCAQIIGTPTLFDGTGNGAGTLKFYTKALGAYATDPTLKMTITHDGAVGIGTDGPYAKLSVEGAGTGDEAVARFNNQGDYASRVWVRNASRSAYISVAPSTGDTIATGCLPYGLNIGLSGSVSPIQFWNGSPATVKMTILTSGNVGIGTTDPITNLHIGPSGSCGLAMGRYDLNGTSRLFFQASNTVKNWRVSQNDALSGAFEITCSASNGAIDWLTYPVWYLNASGDMFLQNGISQPVFKVLNSTGQIYSDAGTTVSSPADFAEWTKVVGDLVNYDVGTVVQQSDEEELAVEVATIGDALYGVVTDRATFLGAITGADKAEWKALENDEEIELFYNAKKIAMVGHIQCKVRGSIVKGQRLTISALAGVARAATTFEEKALAFAIARQSYDSNDVGLIEVRLM